jgi:hypothetical protein
LESLKTITFGWLFLKAGDAAQLLPVFDKMVTALMENRDENCFA